MKSFYKWTLLSFLVSVSIVLIAFSWSNTSSIETQSAREANLSPKNSIKRLVVEQLFSPGQVRMSHYKEEMSCQSCHLPWQKISSQQCQECHTQDDFKRHSIKTQAALHIKIFNQMSCLKCHQEHQGLGAAPVLKNQEFDHEILPKKVLDNCFDCHKEEAEKSHPTMIEKSCVDCHKPEKAWKSEFSHTTFEGLKEYFDGKVPAKDVIDRTCSKCHDNKVEHSTGDFECYSCHKNL